MIALRMIRAAAALAAVSLLAAGCAEEGPEGEPAAGPAPTAASSAAADETAAAAGAWFRNVAPEIGIDFVHDSGYRKRPYFPEIMGGGVAILDFDGDGAQDLYFVQSGSLYEMRTDSARNRLYRNRGDGTFADVTDGSGADDRGYGMGVAVGDYDNDGDPDIFVTNFGPNVLLRNDGAGMFTDVSAEAGVDDPRWAISTTFADLDADGDLDLFVANYVDWAFENEVDCVGVLGDPDYCLPNNYRAPGRDILYRNEGDGTFTEITQEAGLDTAFGYGLGVCCVDFDGDGRLDIFIANDSVFNQLWINQGDGTFVEEGLIRGCAVDEDGMAKAGMGVMAIDYDDDGDRDLLVMNLVRQSDSYYENVDGLFMDRSVAVGLGAVTRSYTRFGLGLHDYNLDGWLDLYIAAGRVVRVQEAIRDDDPYAEPNILFSGERGGKLTVVVPPAGTLENEVFTSRGAAFGDLDGDGALEVVVANRDDPAQIFRNIVRPRGNGIILRPLERSGWNALNAVVTVRLGERTIMRDCLSGYSYAAASDPAICIGLGDATAVDDVTVQWVDGVVEHFGTLEAGVHELRRGEGQN